MGFLKLLYPLTNFEIQKYYKTEPRFNGVFSRNNLPKKNKGWGLYNKSWWICKCRFALFCKNNKIVYFDNFGIEYIPEEIKGFIKEFPGNENINANISWIQENN